MGEAYIIFQACLKINKMKVAHVTFDPE